MACLAWEEWAPDAGCLLLDAAAPDTNHLRNVQQGQHRSIAPREVDEQEADVTDKVAEVDWVPHDAIRPCHHQAALGWQQAEGAAEHNFRDRTTHSNNCTSPLAQARSSVVCAYG